MTKLRTEEVPVAVTVEAAARSLAVSISTVRRLLKHGALKKVSTGRSVRVLERSVREFAERGGAGAMPSSLNAGRVTDGGH